MRKNFGTLLIGVVFLIFGGGYVVARLLGYDPPFFSTAGGPCSS